MFLLGKDGIKRIRGNRIFRLHMVAKWAADLVRHPRLIQAVSQVTLSNIKNNKTIKIMMKEIWPLFQWQSGDFISGICSDFSFYSYAFQITKGLYSHKKNSRLKKFSR